MFILIHYTTLVCFTINSHMNLIQNDFYLFIIQQYKKKSYLHIHLQIIINRFKCYVRLKQAIYSLGRDILV